MLVFIFASCEPLKTGSAEVLNFGQGVYRGWYFPRKGVQNILGVVLIFFLHEKLESYKIPNSEMGGTNLLVMTT